MRSAGGSGEPAPERLVQAGPFDALGFRFDVSAAGAALAAAVDDAFGDLRAEVTATSHFAVVPNPASHDGGRWQVTLDGAMCEGDVVEGYLLALLAWEVSRRVLDRPSPYLLLHAAGVERGGEAVLLAGPTHCGKSTMALALTAAGWGYLTDDVAAVDPLDAKLVPYPKPVLLRDETVGLLAAHLPALAAADPTFSSAERVARAGSVGALGHRAAVAAIVLPRPVAGASNQIEPIPRSAALMALMTDAPHRAGLEVGDFRLLERLVREAPAFRLSMDGIGPAIEAIESIVS